MKFLSKRLSKVINIDNYIELRKEVQWKDLTWEQAQKAIENSLYTVTAYMDNELVGMGRIVGDGAVICYIQDLIVVPSVQSMGVGTLILDKLVDYTDKIRLHNTEMMVCLMCAKGREPFYEKHGFIPRPTSLLGPGMIQYIKD